MSRQRSVCAFIGLPTLGTSGGPWRPGQGRRVEATPPPSAEPRLHICPGWTLEELRAREETMGKDSCQSDSVLPAQGETWPAVVCGGGGAEGSPWCCLGQSRRASWRRGQGYRSLKGQEETLFATRDL